jgi:putative PIN family toxin of toxin-antitoxin system
MRAVFDTNLFVSYLLSHRPPIATLLDVHLAQDNFMLLTAPPLLLELERVLDYPKLKRYYAEEEKKRFLALLGAVSKIVALPEAIPSISRDPDDDWVIACAVVGKADFIVSGDKDLLELDQIDEIKILTPAQFLEILNP